MHYVVIGSYPCASQVRARPHILEFLWHEVLKCQFLKWRLRVLYKYCPPVVDACPYPGWAVYEQILQSYDAVSRKANAESEARCCVARTTQQVQ